MIHTPFRYRYRRFFIYYKEKMNFFCFRMIGSLHSSHHFSRTFQCGPNAKMNRQIKCTVF